MIDGVLLAGRIPLQSIARKIGGYADAVINS
jgi:hypothetical protein